VSSDAASSDRAGGRAPLPARRAGARRARLLVAAAAMLAAGLTLIACTSSSGGTQAGAPAGASTTPAGTESQSSSPTQTPTPEIPDAVITTSPTAHATVSPVQPVTVAVSEGKLTSVKLVNALGKSVAGALSADQTSWKNTEVLGYGKTYTLTAAAVNAAGRPTTKTSTITTLTPGNMTMPYLNTTAGQSLQNGATYGVGIVPVVHFDEQVTDRAAAEKALLVSTSPHVSGVWNWVDAQNVHWRPRNYLAPGTRVTVRANVYGVQVGPGLYGQADQSVSFKIGAKHVSIADDNTHLVKVYFNDRLVKTMPTSMGQGGWVTGTGGQQISLWTMPGTYTVIGHYNPVLMDSSTYGLPVNSLKGYKEYIYQATQISTDGIYLHQLDTTVWAQGHTDVSHGCLNLSYENAHFFYTTSQVGDIVQVRNTGGPKLQIWQNCDWSVPWATWVKGSALH
jgi:lipoprotein-anchoring transpeptidase ErfK/SrfK